MPQVTPTFNLPEEQIEHREAIEGSQWKQVVCEFDPIASEWRCKLRDYVEQSGDDMSDEAFKGIHRAKYSGSNYVKLCSGHRVRLIMQTAENGRFERGSDMFVFDSIEVETWAGWGETHRVKWDDIESAASNFFE